MGLCRVSDHAMGHTHDHKHLHTCVVRQQHQGNIKPLSCRVLVPEVDGRNHAENDPREKEENEDDETAGSPPVSSPQDTTAFTYHLRGRGHHQ